MRDDGYVQPTRPQRIERREEELIMDAQAREVGLVLEAKTLLFAAEGGLPIDKANSPSDSGTRCKPECRTVSCGYSNFAIRDVQAVELDADEFRLAGQVLGDQAEEVARPHRGFERQTALEAKAVRDLPHRIDDGLRGVVGVERRAPRGASFVSAFSRRLPRSFHSGLNSPVSG